MTTEKIPLRKILRDDRCQPRADGLNAEHVEELREAKANGAILPPIVVYRERLRFDGPETIYLSEGFHRFEVYDLDAEEFIEAEVREGGLEEAIDNAMASNAAHGLKRSPGDKKKAVLTMLARHPDWSDRRIAEHLKVSNGYVSTVRREQCAVSTQEDGQSGKTTRTASDGREIKYKPKNPAKLEKFEEVAAKAEQAAEERIEQRQTQPTAILGGFDMKEWSKAFGIVVRGIVEAAKIGNVFGTPEQAAAMRNAEAVRAFTASALNKRSKP